MIVLRSDAERAWLKSMVDMLGIFGFSLLALSVGAVIYVLSRQTVIPLAVALWLQWEWLRGILSQITGDKCIPREILLADRFGLERFDADAAFSVLQTYRDENGDALWSKEAQERFFRQHSENHLLYATSLVLFLGSVGYLLRFGIISLWFLFLLVAIVLAFFALLSDIQVSKRDAAHLNLAGLGRIGSVLADAGFRLSSAPVDDQSTASNSDPAPGS